MDIFDQILKWHIIAQGALGSALFWLVLILGQKVTAYISCKLERDREVSTFFCILAKASPNMDQRVRGYLNCLYGGFHYFLKATIIIILSLLVSPVNWVISTVGYLISVYFLFRALSYVQHFSSLETYEDAIQKMKSLGKKYVEK